MAIPHYMKYVRDRLDDIHDDPEAIVATINGDYGLTGDCALHLLKDLIVFPFDQTGNRGKPNSPSQPRVYNILLYAAQELGVHVALESSAYGIISVIIPEYDAKKDDKKIERSPLIQTERLHFEQPTLGAKAYRSMIISEAIPHCITPLTCIDLVSKSQNLAVTAVSPEIYSTEVEEDFDLTTPILPQGSSILSPFEARRQALAHQNINNSGKGVAELDASMDPGLVHTMFNSLCEYTFLDLEQETGISSTVAHPFFISNVKKTVERIKTSDVVYESGSLAKGHVGLVPALRKAIRAGCVEGQYATIFNMQSRGDSVVQIALSPPLDSLKLDAPS